jgi:CTP:molybdopterin cytidylyltransferase MocA
MFPPAMPPSSESVGNLPVPNTPPRSSTNPGWRMSIAALVLAAGEASRFGSPKQRLLLPRVLERVRASSVDQIVVVEGAYDLDPGGDVRIVACPEWHAGPGASLRCGVSALGDDVEAAVVVLADGPELSPEAVDRVVGEWRRGGGIVAASYEGSRGHPLVLGRSEWRQIPDEGLRDQRVQLVPCDDLGAPGDVDRPEDLPKL